MKVLIFADAAKYGGTRSFLIKLINIHSKIGDDVTLVIDKNDFDNQLQELLIKFDFNLVLNKPRSSIFRHNYFSLIFEAFTFSPIILKIKPDLIISSTGSPGFNFFLFMLRRTPLAYFLHSTPTKFSFKSYLFFVIPKLLSSENKFIVTVSQYLSSELIKLWGVPEKYTKIVYNSPHFIGSDFLKKEINPQKKIILTVGHVVWYKNPKLWLEVAKKITHLYDDIEFLWIGEGDLLDEMRLKCINYDRIKLIGARSDVQMYYSSSYLYFQPSIVESFGISVIEAQFFGLPSIVSDAGGLPETILNGQSGFVVRNNLEKYLKAFVIILNDKLLYKQMSNSAENNVKHKFTATKQEENIMQIYNLITNGRK
jgi:glycosyltransferase involved in cell wall biosynthesis